ncbi:enolase 4-like [Branchiostoma lanceolatum]|uniref:enolase 4-like n=1 Tax=Branchiostoma lanceolatum TaxID=7740 RepID=UPI003455CD34
MTSAPTSRLGGATTSSSAREARELYELKQQAVKFYQDNLVPQRMEQVLNDMFYENPEDVYGHLAEYFQQFAKPPTVSQVTVGEVADCRGQPTIQAEIHGVVNNVDKVLCTVTVPTSKWDATITEEEETEMAESLKVAMEYLAGPITEALSGTEVANQREGDQRVKNFIGKILEDFEEELKAKKAKEEEESPRAPTPKVAPSEKGGKGKKGKGSATSVILPPQPKEELPRGIQAVCAASLALLEAGAQASRQPLYSHVAALRPGEVSSKLRLPLPMVCVYHGGRAGPGKLNCIKELLIMPKPGLPFKEAMRMLTNIHNQVGKALAAKSGVTARNTTDLGAYAPLYDKLEQPLDLVQEALAALELQAGEDVHMAINCAAHEMFELEKGKYEVMTGTQKTPDDMVDFYNDILTRYPGVIALIDPLRKQDKTAWVKLTQAVSEKCYLMGDEVYPRTEKFLVQGMEETRSSAAVFSLHSLTTVSDVMDAAKLVEDGGSEVVLAACQGDTADTMLADLAVGLAVKFAKFGGLGRGERVAKYNRLAQIEAQLADQDKLAPHEEHRFPNILPPPPPEEPEGEAAT